MWNLYNRSLSQHLISHTRFPPRWRKIGLLTLAMGIIVFVIWGLSLRNQVIRVNTGLKFAEQTIATMPLITQGSASDMDSIQNALKDGEAGLVNLRRSLVPVFWLTPILTHIPSHGGDIKQGRRLIDYSLHVVRAAGFLLEALEPIVPLLQNETSSLEMLLETKKIIETNQGLILKATFESEQGSAIRLDIEEAALSQEIQQILAQGDVFATKLDSLIEATLQAPETISVLVSIRNQLSTLQDHFTTFETTGLTTQELKTLDSTLASIQMGVLRMKAQTPYIDSLSPYLNIDYSDLGSTIDFTLEFLKVSRRILSEMGPVMESLEGGLQPQILEQKLRTAAEPLQSALDLINQMDNVTEHIPLFGEMFPVGQNLDTYTLTLRQTVEAALQAPALLQKLGSLQNELEVLRKLFDSSDSQEPQIDFEALTKSGQISEELLGQLILDANDLLPGLRILGLDHDEVVTNLSFYLTFLRTARQTMLVLQPLYEILEQGYSQEEFYGVLSPDSITNFQFLDEASRQLISLRRTQDSLGSSPYLPSHEDLARGLSTLEAVVRIGQNGLELVELMKMMKEHETLIQALFSDLDSPIQLALGDLSPYQESVQKGQAYIHDARDQLAEFGEDLPSVGVLERLATTFNDFDILLEAVDHGFSGAFLTLNATEEFARIKERGLFSPVFSAELQSVLPIAMDRVSEAQIRIEQGLVTVAPLVSPRPSSFLEHEAIGVQLMLTSASTAMDRAAAYLQALNYLLGLDGERTFLLLGQDDIEIRATGGFIGTVHELVLDRGGLRLRKFLDSYEVNSTFEGQPIGPWAFCRYWKGTTCLQSFRDSNWSPDFPTSARLALDIYYAGQGITADGVIAVDSQVMAQVVDAFGGVELPGFSQTIDGARARELAAEVEGGYTCGTHNTSNKPNRCFTEDLINLLLPLIAESPGISPVLFEILIDALAEKHVLVYVQDEKTVPLLRTLNWDGHLLDAHNDYLMVVDTSVYSKVHDSIQRDIDYNVNFDDHGIGAASLTITYSNSVPREPSCEQPLGSCYWNYFRVYVPSGSILLAAPDLPLPTGTIYESNASLFGYEVDSGDTFSFTEDLESGKTELAGFIAPPGGRSTQVTFKYQLPAKTTNETDDGTWRYRLVIQKQPGTLEDQVTFTLTLPEGATLIEASPSPDSIKESQLVFTTKLNTDKDIFVEFSAN